MPFSVVITIKSNFQGALSHAVNDSVVLIVVISYYRLTETYKCVLLLQCGAWGGGELNVC